MAVFRVERNAGYTVMSNHHLRNKNLTLKAKGLLSQMLSLPEDWDFTLAGLSYINREKIDAIREAIRELEKAGYIVRSRERDEKGRLRGADYVIYEQPQQPTLDLPTLENPTLDNPTLEKPTLENRTLLNTNRLNTKVLNTNNKKVSKEQSSKPVENFNSIIEEATESEELRSALIEFVKFRKLVKKPMTNKALELIISKLNRLGSSDREKVEIINQSIERGWSGVFALKSDEPMQQGRYGQPTQPYPY